MATWLIQEAKLPTSKLVIAESAQGRNRRGMLERKLASQISNAEANAEATDHGITIGRRLGWKERGKRR
ncbi:hypothetical protein AnigIFM60653_005465 [Aspergillus niger]|nr:hypothetical protein AnigIFM60653_005465 [Aspergillus niger]GLA39498.1 hypothetical protein AnigIFM63309_006837 [Aspergillus niger]